MSTEFRAGYNAVKAVEGFFSTLAAVISALFHPSVRMRKVSPGREQRETQEALREVRELFERSPLSGDKREDFALDLALEACKWADVTPTQALLETLTQTVIGLMIEEGLWGVPEVDPATPLSLEEGVEIRNYILLQKRLLSDYDRYIAEWRTKLLYIFSGMLGYIPNGVIEAKDRERRSGRELKSRLIDLADEPALVIERLFATLDDKDVLEMRLFERVRNVLYRNLLLASGIDPREEQTTKRSVVFPTALRDKSPGELVDLYLKGTPFADLLRARCAFEIPEAVRFEHCHIVGGTGHGKTQLLQLLIRDDLQAAREGKCSVIVIDSQGDLIKTISRLRYFSPQAERSLAEKVVIVDPNDTDYPVCLNMFDLYRDRGGGISGADRERMLNATVSLYEYMFGALLGAELTQRQGVIFKYLARLMMHIPGATVHTLRALMEDAEPFRPYIRQLEGSARAFFETQFFSKTFDATKKQILARLWGVLSNSVFDRMFTHERNAIDMFEAMNSGKIVLVNTAKDLLQKDGCQILGRFFIAMIGQAAVQRAILSGEKRLPSFVYVDEAHEYFDDQIEDLLNQARKFKVGLVLAHQNLDQLGTKLKATFMASTSIKLAGGVSAKDAAAFSKEMGCTPQFIAATKKRKTYTEFACWVKNVTSHAIKISVPLGVMEREPVMSESSLEKLIAVNRERYCAPVRVVEPTVFPESVEQPAPPAPAPIPPVPEVSPVPSAAEPLPASEPELALEEEAAAVPRAVDRPAPAPQAKPSPEIEQAARQRKVAKPSVPTEPAPLGRGGRQHKYLQELVKQSAESLGFRATIEQPVAEGGGSVDVLLAKGDLTIACEISVTSTPEQELGNVKKCLAAGYDRVMVISSEAAPLKKLERHIGNALENEELEKIAFLLPDACLSYLRQVAPEEPKVSTVRGYTVKLKHKALSDEEIANRRKAIGQVIAGSVRRMRE